ncbi:hypothetical protein R6Z07F_010356 [Ovis aries]
MKAKPPDLLNSTREKDQKRAREGGKRDRVSRGGDRAGQRGEREPGQSEAKPDRAEPAADTRNQPPRPRPRLTLTGCPSQSTPTCPRPPPILERQLQTGALFGQWRQDEQEAAC